MNDFPKVLTVSDLVVRWDGMARQSIHQRIGDKDFPKPVQYVSNGRIALFLESDIEKFEETHPWIKDSYERQRRATFIFRKIANGDFEER